MILISFFISGEELIKPVDAPGTGHNGGNKHYKGGRDLLTGQQSVMSE